MTGGQMGEQAGASTAITEPYRAFLSDARSAKHLRFLFVLSVLFGVLETFAVGLTIDKKTLLHYTIHMLQGGMYDRWLAANLPLSMWLYSVPVFLTLKLHIPTVYAIHVPALALCALSIWLLSRSLKAHGVSPVETRLWVTIAAVALFIAPATFSVFADREHLLFVFITPWLIQMLLDKKPSAFTSLFAAVGFCIKPYNIVIFILVTLACGIAQGNLRKTLFSTSSWIIGIFGGLYGMCVLLFYPSYFHTMLPLSSTTYPIYRIKPLQLLRVAAVIIIPMLLITASARLPRGFLWRFSGLITGCVLVYCLNGYWIYTFYILAYPFAVALLLALASQYGKRFNWKNSSLYLLSTMGSAGCDPDACFRYHLQP